jgi:hypothetical protein
VKVLYGEGLEQIPFGWNRHREELGARNANEGVRLKASAPAGLASRVAPISVARTVKAK